MIKKKPGRKPKALTIDTCDSMFTPNYFTTSSSTGASASGGDQLPRKRGRPRLTPLTQSSTNITTTTTTTDGELTTTTSTMNPDPSEGEVSKKRGRKKKIVESVESVEPTVRRKPGRPWKRSKPDDVGGSQDRESNDDGNMDESLKRGDDDDGSSEDDDGESNEDEDSDSDEESEYEEKDDNIRPPVSKRSGPRGVSKLSINDDEEDDDDNHDGNYNRNDENKRTEKVVATTSYARTTIPSVDSHSSDTLQSKLTDDEKLTKYLAFLDKIVAQKDPIISQQERQVLKVIHAISKLQVVFTPELLKQVAVFGQLKNHVVPEIANAAKVQVKLWKTQVCMHCLLYRIVS